MPLEPSYSHIYVENGAADYPFAKSLLEKFKRAKVINIHDYKEVFNRPKQDFDLQKHSILYRIFLTPQSLDYNNDKQLLPTHR